MSQATIEDDAISIYSKCSTSSITNEKMICNFCKKEFQQRVIFNHLIKKHENDFYFNIDISNLKRAIKLKCYYEMDLLVPDERDETETKLYKLYCVFGTDYKTNKGYLASHNATNYLKKNPNAVKEHLTQLNKLLKKKEDDKKKGKASQLLRGSTCIQIKLKITYHFISYSDHPLIMLENKQKDTCKERERREELFKQFNTLIRSLSSDAKKILTDTELTNIKNLYGSSVRFFDGLVGWVDRTYDYPPWVETMYQSCCTEDNPSGRRLGEKRDYMNYLTYPGDIEIIKNDF